MRPTMLAYFLVFMTSLGSARDADAGVKVTTTVSTYAIEGNTGAALLAAMDRNGPKQAFLARSIAQTLYTMDWSLDLVQSGGTCRLRNAQAHLLVSYTFPAVTHTLPDALDKRWRAFMVGTRKHEQTHGRLAREMVGAAEKAIRTIRIANDTNCVKAKREAKRRIASVYAAYERRQLAFDATEHSAGGKVEKLIDALVGPQGH